MVNSSADHNGNIESLSSLVQCSLQTPKLKDVVVNALSAAREVGSFNAQNSDRSAEDELEIWNSFAALCSKKELGMSCLSVATINRTA